MVGQRLTLAILVALSALSQIDRSIISLMVGPISRDLGIDDVQIGLLQGLAFGLFYAAFGLPFGIAADRWSRRRLIFAGVVIWSLAAAACGLAANFHQLLAARFFVGAGEAALAPAAYSLISDIFPRRRLAGALAVFGIGAAVGAGVAMGLGGLLIDLLSVKDVTVPLLGAVRPWQAVFLATGTPGLILAFLIFLVPEPGRGARDAAAATWAALGGFLLRRRAVLACHFLGFSLLGMLAYGGGAWIPTLLIRRYGFTAGQAGSAYGLTMCVTTIVGMLAAGAVLDALIRKGVSDAALRFFTWTTPMMAVVSIAGCLSPHPALFLLAVGLAQIGLCVAGPASTALQLVTPPEMRGRVSALFILTFNLVGFGLGPLLIASLTVYGFRDPKAVNLSVASAYVILAPLAWLLFRAGLKPMRTAMADS
jgi:MFS family permease